MEYPFKDLLPLDEVLEREGYYKDWTHLDPEVFYSLTQISEYIKTKGFGVDVRLLIAQLAEHFGLKTTQVVDLANILQQKFTNLEGVTQSFTNNINSLVAQMEADKDAVIANATVDSEVILARGGKPTLGARLDETTTRLAQNALREVSEISVSDFGALGSNTPTTLVDEGTQIVEAFNYAIENDIRIVKFPNNYYKTSKKLPILNNRISILGVDNNTIIEYTASEDGSFIEAPRTDTIVKNIELRITSGNYKTVGIEAYRGNREAWGGKITTENVTIRGYSDAGIRVYAPYRTYIKNTYVNGVSMLEYATPRGNLPPETTKIGIDFVGESIFGNVNTIENSRVQLNRYGLKLTNVGSTLITDCTFEHNWVHISNYIPSTSTNKFGSRNTVINSWFENNPSNGTPSRTDGSIVSFELDEITGEEKTGGSQGEIFVTNSQIHTSTNKIDNKNQAPYSYSPNRVIGGTTAEMEANNRPVWRWSTSTYGDLIRFDANEAYFMMPVASRDGFKQIATNKITDSVNKIVRSITRYNPSSPNSNLFTVLLGELDIDSNTVYRLKAFTHINASDGNPVYVESELIIDRNLIRGQKSTVLDGIYALEIDEKNQGVRLSLENGQIKAEFKATNASYARISLEITEYLLTS